MGKIKLYNKLPSRSVLTTIFILIGIGMVIYRYYLNTSLWYDTAVLALEVLDRSYADLTVALEYQVVAPVLFLFAEKLFLSLLNNSDYGLRLIPLLCFLVSIPLMYKVALMLTNNRDTAISSVCLFSVSPMILTYSTEAKQYSGDVFILLLILYLGVRTWQAQSRRYIALFIVGSISIFWSFVSVIPLATVGLFLLYQGRNKRTATRINMLLIIVWLGVFLLYYNLLHRTIFDDGTLINLWSEGKFFWTREGVIESATYIVKVMARATFGNSLHHWVWKLFALLYVTGVALLLYQRNYYGLFFILFPLLVHLLISAFKLYPVAPRLILYQVPLYIITISVLTSFVSNYCKSYIRIPLVLFTPAAITLVLILLHGSFSGLYKDGGMKNGLKYVLSNLEREDVVYIYHPAVRSFMYYRKVGHFDADNNVILGVEALDHSGEIPQRLSSVKQRIWVIFTELNWENEEEEREGRFLIEYLSSRGPMLERVENSMERIYLFQL